jgi:hypothetical protein
VAKRGEIEIALRRLAPRIPAHEFAAVVDHAADSLVAYVRHVFTDYDDLLMQDYDQDSARHFVADEIAAVLNDWGVRRRLSADD